MFRHLPTLVFITFLFVVITCHAQQKESGAASGNNPAVTQSKRPKYDEVYHAMVSDLVVIGEVVNVADMPGPESECFHSKTIVKIDSVLRGKIKGRTLVLLSTSGPITDKHLIFHWSTDAYLKVGDRGIFFLHRPDRDNFLESPYIQLHHSTFYGRYSLSDLPDSVFWGDNVCRDAITNGTVDYPWGIIKVDAVIKEIENPNPVDNHPLGVYRRGTKEMLYTSLLAAHSAIRWLVLISLLYAICRGFRGRLSNGQFTRADNAAKNIASMIVRVQFVIGILLYIVSPITRYFITNIKEVAAIPQVAMFGWMHPVGMTIGITLVEIGNVRARRVSEDRKRFSAMTIFYLIGLIVMLASIPWPLSPRTPRPYVRSF